jgi:signal peptidase II
MTTLAGMPGQSFLGDTIRLDYHENPGGFLSTGATWRPEIRAIVFQFLNAVVLTAAGFLALRHQWSRWAKTGLAMFLAGGVSNLVDRVATGRVIDFLNVGIGPFRTGIFNVADIAIVVGIALLLVEHWRRPATV